MTQPAYVPERGDVVWLDFEPHLGHEQGGRRPALVLTKSRYNRLTGLALFLPITSQVKGYVMEVELPPTAPVRGVVLTDQIRNMSWRHRKADYIGSLPADLVQVILQTCQGMLA